MSVPIASGEPKPSGIVGPSSPIALSPVPRIAIESSTKSASAMHRSQEPLARDRLPLGLLDAADVRGDEHVEHHHGARVDHDLGGGDELGVEGQKEARERHQMDDQREHAVEGVLERDDRNRAANGADRAGEEHHLFHRPRILFAGGCAWAQAEPAASRASALCV